MKKIIIISRIESFDFPLYEATRKQIWWNAKKYIKKGFNVKIIILSNFEKNVVKDKIEISIVNRWRFIPLIKAEKIIFICGSINIWILFCAYMKGKKNLILTDGDMYGAKNRFFRNFIKKFFPYIFNKIIVYSQYQRKKLNLKNTIIKKPLLPSLNLDKKFERYKRPTLLYMGHISYFKGVDTILKSYSLLIHEYPNINLIIANNSLLGDESLIKKVLELKKKYPNNIELKGVVNPLEELSRCWVYLYPFKQAMGTMSFALSLYESSICKTPYIACDVGANKEFFKKEYLINVNDHFKMYKMIKFFINERKIKKNL